MKRSQLAWSILLALILSCQTRQDLASNASEGNETPDQESWNAQITTTANGKLASKIKYGYLQRFSKRKLVKLSEGVEVDLYDDAGRHVSKVICKEAVLNEDANTLELLGDVAVVSDNGLRVNTEKLFWREQQGEITSSELVRVITADNDTIFGVGFESESSLENWTILKPWGVTQKKLNLKLNETQDDSANSQR
jgi:LPS export ABC transporter protein LptC